MGLHDQKVADFEDAGELEVQRRTREGSLAAEPAGHDGAGLKLTYDFSQSTATRAAYATPPQEIPVAGQPQSFTMWIKSDGKGAWPSLHLKDAGGTDQVLRGDLLSEEGWQQITFEVPEGVAYPLRLHRFYLAETAARRAVHRRGRAGRAGRPDPARRRPAGPPRTHDPLISTATDVAGRDWRFAVMSDAQFVARDPGQRRPYGRPAGPCARSGPRSPTSSSSTATWSTRARRKIWVRPQAC